MERSWVDSYEQSPVIGSLHLMGGGQEWLIGMDETRQIQLKLKCQFSRSLRPAEATMWACTRPGKKTLRLQEAAFALPAVGT